MDDDKKVVISFPIPAPETSISPEERARRLTVEVERLARLPTVEWMYYVEDTAKQHGVESAELKAMVVAVIKEREKQARIDKADEREREQRAEKKQAAAQREARRAEDREQREQRREQERADRAAERKQRERDKALAEIAKLPGAVHEQQLAALAERLGEDLSFLRQEFSTFVAEGTCAAAASIALGPWPEPVDLNELLLATTAQIRRYVAIHEEYAATTVVLWIAFAWMHDIAVHSPILRIIAGDVDAGKTTLCGVLKLLTPRASTAAELTGPALFRFVDQVHPTLIIDNADRLLRKKPDLASIIEAGWTRATPIPRVVNGHPYLFDVFCPKILGGVDLPLDPATLSRCLEVRLWPKLPGETFEDFQYVDDDAFLTLRRKWARWANDHAEALKTAAPAMPGLNNRVKMNWRLQFAIAELAGGGWPKAVHKAATELAHERHEPSRRRRALATCWDAFAKLGPLVTSAQLEAVFRADDEWGDTITKWQIKDLLAPFGIHPRMIHPPGRPAARGYSAAWFERDFLHYLGKDPPPNRTQTYASRGKPRKSRR